jgi:hypothetical protein
VGPKNRFACENSEKSKDVYFNYQKGYYYNCCKRIVHDRNKYLIILLPPESGQIQQIKDNPQNL